MTSNIQHFTIKAYWRVTTNFWDLISILDHFCPVQDQMEWQFSKSAFRKFWSTSGGCPISRKFGSVGNFLFHWGFHFDQTLGTA